MAAVGYEARGQFGHEATRQQTGLFIRLIKGMMKYRMRQALREIHERSDLIRHYQSR